MITTNGGNKKSLSTGAMALETLIELIKSGEEDKAINMVNSFKKHLKGRPYDEVLEMRADQMGITALMTALFYERDKVARFLIGKSNLAALDCTNMSPLSYACLTGNIKNIKFIYDNIKDRDSQHLFFIKNSAGRCPMDYLLTHLESINKYTK